MKSLDLRKDQRTIAGIQLYNKRTCIDSIDCILIREMDRGYDDFEEHAWETLYNEQRGGDDRMESPNSRQMEMAEDHDNTLT